MYYTEEPLASEREADVGLARLLIMIRCTFQTICYRHKTFLFLTPYGACNMISGPIKRSSEIFG